MANRLDLDEDDRETLLTLVKRHAIICRKEAKQHYDNYQGGMGFLVEADAEWLEEFADKLEKK